MTCSEVDGIIVVECRDTPRLRDALIGWVAKALAIPFVGGSFSRLDYTTFFFQRLAQNVGLDIGCCKLLSQGLD